VWIRCRSLKDDVGRGEQHRYGASRASPAGRWTITKVEEGSVHDDIRDCLAGYAKLPTPTRAHAHAHAHAHACLPPVHHVPTKRY